MSLRTFPPLWFFATALVVCSAATPRAEAACVSGQAITNDCQLDLVTGPVLASSRAVSLGGAYQAIGGGLAGYTSNAAAPAVRDPWSHDWFGWDVDASITFPTAFRNIDFENRGAKNDFTYKNFYFLTLGGNLQLGAWGFGFFSDLQLYNLSPGAGANDASFQATVSKTHVLLARQLFDGNLVVGVGARLVGFNIGRTGGGQPSATVVSLSGAAPELGLLWRPAEQPFRIGATYRARVAGNPSPDNAPSVNGSIIPQHANLPWELDAGFAVQAGSLPLNDPWINPHDVEADLRGSIRRARARRVRERTDALDVLSGDARRSKERELDAAEAATRKHEDQDLTEFRDAFHAQRKARYEAFDRNFLLFSLGLLVVGPTDDGVSLESFFSQKVARSGRLTTYSPRAGLESEVVPGYLRARIGGYVEPTRFGSEPDARAFRQHVTAGLDVYLFRWTAFGLLDDGTAWRLTTAVDVAPRYQNYGLSVGIWH
ncbi:MAG: hypothetical protein NVSMB47_07080 [Polyangiales bacterium]